jgi:hypothetical protein
MPYLGDYIGQLLSEITMARVQADLEAVRVAELYAGHPLLRHMPVPHFRLPDVDVEIPVAIKQMEERRPEEPIRGAPSATELRATLDKVLQEQLEKRAVRLTPTQKNKLSSALDQKVAAVMQPPEVAVDVTHIADNLAKSVPSLLSKIKGPAGVTEAPGMESLEAELKISLRAEFVKLRKPPPRLVATVTTAEIREAGPSESIVRFHLKITEQAFEWTMVESEGRSEDRLVPE